MRILFLTLLLLVFGSCQDPIQTDIIIRPYVVVQKTHKNGQYYDYMIKREVGANSFNQNYQLSYISALGDKAEVGDTVYVYLSKLKPRL